MQKSSLVARAIGAVSVAAALAAMSACSSGDKLNGEEKKKPEQVLTDANSALKASKTVHVVGSEKDDSGEAEKIDVHYLNGTGAYGSFSAAGKRQDLIRVGNDIYVKGDPLMVGDSAPPPGKYAKVSATNDDCSDAADLTDLKTFADNEVDSSTRTKPTVEKGDSDGTKAVVVTQNDEDEAGRVYVANTGKPLPLQVARTDKSAERLAFSDYGSDVQLKAPAAADTVSGSC